VEMRAERPADLTGETTTMSEYAQLSSTTGRGQASHWRAVVSSEQRLEIPLQREPEPSASQAPVAERICMAKVALSTFDIQDFGPGI
jgi:hypothetical protein